MGGRAVNPIDHFSTRHGRGAYAFVRPGRVHIRRAWQWE
jgi:hypothetical protein